MASRARKGRLFGLSAEITRRDFVGGALLGAGVTLLSSTCPAAARELDKSWTGYAGVGDYRSSNGNTADVVRSAHRIRDGIYDHGLRNVIDTRETFDAVIVGSGFAGMTALYEFNKARPHGTCLMIDNHPIFGGEAKQNEFDVDGYRLVGPQGSNSTGIMLPDTGQPGELWRELGLPDHFDFAAPDRLGSPILFEKTNYESMYFDDVATIGYFFQNEKTGDTGAWVKNIWQDDLKRAPLPERLKKDLIAWRDYKICDPEVHKEIGPWLDSMTRLEFLTKVAGFSPDVLRYENPGLGAIFAATSDVLSAYATFAYLKQIAFMGFPKWPYSSPEISFPGGNTTLLRHFVKAVLPDAIIGPRRFDAIANNPVNFAALDRADSNLKMRLSATAVRITHKGEPTSAEGVELVYEKGGQLFRVKAKGAVLAIGSWVAKHVVGDVTPEYREALASMPHGPILTVNVALHNWRFLEKLGISAARWFDGFGWFANIRQPMLVGDRPTPFNPDKPAILTFYVPFLKPGLPIEAQGPAGRQELYGTTYAEFERQIVMQMQRLFGSVGFNAQRDIAGIVLNRWGHALVSPPPGFFFGRNGKPSPLQVLRKRFGRISFGHSELNSGGQNWVSAAEEGKRAITQILEVL